MSAHQLDPVGATVQDRFALMLHDRIIEIEQELRSLRPKPLDPRIRVLSSHDRSDSGGVFVRIRSKTHVDTDAWSRVVLERLARLDPTRYDLWCCQHWSLGHEDGPYVLECLVERRGTACVADVAHAALDSTTTEATDGAATSVETCAVTSCQWFAESIRAAAAASGRATLHSWDPVAGSCVSQDINDYDETRTRTPQEHAAWTMLYGWLASQVERAEVWHPRALTAPKLGLDLVTALASTLDHAGHAGAEA